MNIYDVEFMAGEGECGREVIGVVAENFHEVVDAVDKVYPEEKVYQITLYQENALLGDGEE